MNADKVNHPSYYNDGKIEVIDFIEDKRLNFHRGNAIKYIARDGKKDPDKTVEDLKKAVWYLNREIENLTGDNPLTKAAQKAALHFAQRLESLLGYDDKEMQELIISLCKEILRNDFEIQE